MRRAAFICGFASMGCFVAVLFQQQYVIGAFLGAVALIHGLLAGELI